MMKYISVLLALLCAVSLVAAPKQNKKNVLSADFPKKFTPRETQWIQTSLSPEYLQGQMTAIAKNFLQKKNYSLSEISFDIQKLKDFNKYYFVESDSGFSRRWIAQNIAYAEALEKAKIQMNDLIINKKTATEEYRKWYDYYVKTAKQYIAVSKKPIKVQDKKKIARLNKIKAVVVEQLKAKEEAEKAKQPVLNEKKKRR